MQSFRLSAVVMRSRPVHRATQHAQRRHFEKIAWSDAQRALSSREGLFVDVRSPGMFKDARADGFDNVPLNELATKLASAPRTERVYIIDQYGYYSERAARQLEGAGFADVRVVDGGLFTWAFRGGPLASDNASLAPKLRRADATEKPTLAAAEAAAAELGVTVDLQPERFPLLDVHFRDPAEREEAHAKSYARRK